jgi:hypothetical protein
MFIRSLIETDPTLEDTSYHMLKTALLAFYGKTIFCHRRLRVTGNCFGSLRFAAGQPLPGPLDHLITTGTGKASSLTGAQRLAARTTDPAIPTASCISIMTNTA